MPVIAGPGVQKPLAQAVQAAPIDVLPFHGESSILDFMTLKDRIEGKMKSVLLPQHMELVNESGNHNVPKGSETHFKLLLVAKTFEGKSLVQRHRMVYALVEQEMKEGLHALALQTYT